jgi:3-deoxy-D-manno-octulosonate 8-phosphate phosphatase (KDO 8-P phosphatase)
MAEETKTDFSALKMLIVDVDGVLTDGGIIINSDGSEGRRFSVLDEHRIRMWQRGGLLFGIISGKESECTSIFAERLGIKFVLQGCKKKLGAFENLLEENSLSLEEVAFIGDDLVDLPLIRRAGIGIAVANAVEEVKAEADIVTKRCGGNGAVGEIIENILKSRGQWEALTERYRL